MTKLPSPIENLIESGVNLNILDIDKSDAILIGTVRLKRRKNKTDIVCLEKGLLTYDISAQGNKYSLKEIFMCKNGALRAVFSGRGKILEYELCQTKPSSLKISFQRIPISDYLSRLDELSISPSTG